MQFRVSRRCGVYAGIITILFSVSCPPMFFYEREMAMASAWRRGRKMSLCALERLQFEDCGEGHLAGRWIFPKEIDLERPAVFNSQPVVQSEA